MVFSLLIESASFNERLLLSNGLCVSPLQGFNNEQSTRSLRDVVFQIDNAKDLNNYVSSFAPKVGNTGDIKYERHPVQIPTHPPIIDIRALSDPQTLNSSQQPPPPINTRVQPLPAQQPSIYNSPSPSGPIVPSGTQAFPQGSGSPSTFTANNASQDGLTGSPQNLTFSSMAAGGPPQLPPSQTSTPFYSQQPPQIPMGMQTHQSNNSHSSLPALRPVFGVSLEDLLKRDGSAIPLVVYQCIQAVDLYGLEVEGIYRLSGSTTHVSKLRLSFDHGSGSISLYLSFD